MSQENDENRRSFRENCLLGATLADFISLRCRDGASRREYSAQKNDKHF
jgi:hypothetical protein